jgi:hypothetical protein
MSHETTRKNTNNLFVFFFVSVRVVSWLVFYSRSRAQAGEDEPSPRHLFQPANAYPELTLIMRRQARKQRLIQGCSVFQKQFSPIQINFSIIQNIFIIPRKIFVEI